MAATSATSGMATKTPTKTRWNVEVGSSSRSGRVGRIRVLVVPPMGPADAGVVGDETRSAVVAASRALATVASAALTVSGDVVIVLLWISENRAGAFVRLRNRSLRNRKLGKAWQMNFCIWAYEFRMHVTRPVSTCETV